MSASAVRLLDSFAALSGSARCRVLSLLDGQELTVSELCAVLHAPQSTVSRHLKTLGDAGWVSSRRDGTSRYYTLGLRDGAPQTEIWSVARRELDGRAASREDRRRLARVLARRRETSKQFFATSAGQWDRLREDLFGADFFLQALVDLIPSDWTVGDLGCGTGALVATLATSVARVIGVDASDEMLAAARARVAAHANVDLRHGTLESLPIDDGALDAATMVLVLHHVAAPAAALT